ncbi:MAG: HAMP domain-containing sensor histidine kinase [Nitrospiraceae bacterium]|nr:HAMP domain-containing sensor histidine kinase [Nitrospiraceae bacterium]
MYTALVIVAFVSVVTYLHYSTISAIHALHDIYKELYYIPILVAALVFGLRGAVATFFLIGVLYFPYMISSWTGDPATEANKILHLLLQGLFAFLAGFFVDRDKKHALQEEKDRYLAGIGQAAAAIVHDLRNPLITILGFAKRLEEGKGGRETSLQAIRESALTMQSIVHDVLDFSKPVTLKMTEEDFRDTVRRACDSCKTRAQEAGVFLTIELTPEPLPADVDGTHLERAIVNLINNAIDASSRDQNVVIKVTPERQRLTVSIKDSGAGMDKETLENIFIPFYTKKSSGTGLGMPIARKIVEGHRGKINITSKPGQGTEITIEIPWQPKKEQP